MRAYIEVLDEKATAQMTLASDRRPLEESRNRQAREHKTTAFWKSNKPPIDIIELSRRHFEPPSGITAAVCFKTLFGDSIDMKLVLQWVAYNRLLGFDHIYMFYRPEVARLDGFEDLRSLPYVSLNERVRGKLKSHYDQWGAETECLREPKYGAKYDWVMSADLDEYLQFNRTMGLKEFLQEHHQMTYLTFGKYMYTLDHRVDVELTNHVIDASSNDHFAVSHYPYHMKHYCYARRNPHRMSSPICPTWHGRSKLIVRPKHHDRFDIHGSVKDPKPEEGMLAVHPYEARFAEFIDLFSLHNVTQHADRKNFVIQYEHEVHIHEMTRAFKPMDDQGHYLIEYDNWTKTWFDYVIGRASTPKETTSM